MRETIEFRIAEKDARRFLKPEDGIVMGISSKWCLDPWGWLR